MSEPLKDGLRERARQELGVGVADDRRGLRAVLRDERVGAYAMVALGLLGIADQLQSYALLVLTPEMSRSLGLSLAAIAGARSVQFMTVAISPLPMAWLAQKRARRAMLCLVTGAAWSFVTLWTGLVTSFVLLLVVLALNGLATGSVAALHTPLLSDSYPPRARVRVFSGYAGIVASGRIMAPLLVALLAGVLDLTWRGVFIGLGVLSTVLTLCALGLRDPGFGRFDTDRVVSVAGGTKEADADDTELGFFEITRRLLLIPTVRRLAVGNLVFGIMVIPFATFVSVFLDEKWGLGPGERGAFFAGQAAIAIAALMLYGRRGERAFRKDPAQVVTFAGVSLAVAVVLIAVGAMTPWFWLMFALLAASEALITLLNPGINIVMLSVVEARWRPHLAAVMGIYTTAGSVLGIFFLTGIESRFGVSGAIAALMVPGLVGAVVVGSARRFVVRDFDDMVDGLLEAEEVAEARRSGHPPSLLACRGIDFSYGSLQVLFDVDFTVQEGEMVALLGTNGAGKSTLLKVVSGLALPQRGTVRLRGDDVTYLDAERRVRLGVSQIPGGRAVFGPMTVAENLRAYAYTLGRDRRSVNAAIDRSFAAFPRLADRRNAPAQTLSGGEQQMLALSKALLLRPRLLLIDELSLGLAPVVVEQLMHMVREINAEGAAVVLVEQSVNIALSLVDHAYFMEKGQIRFDGGSGDLAGRGDLLRAVFLDGVGSEAGR